MRDLDRETLLIADERGPARDRRDHGRRRVGGVRRRRPGSSSSRRSSTRSRSAAPASATGSVPRRASGSRRARRSRLARIGADRAARLIAEWAGGAVARGRVDSAPAEPGPARVPFRPGRVNRLLGTALTTGEQREELARVGVETDTAGNAAERVVPVADGSKRLTATVDGAGEELVVAVVPTWRRDIAIEADVAEEIARVRGYETIPSILPHTPMPTFRPSPLAIRDRMRETLAGAGLTEVVSHALVSPAEAERYAWTAETPPVDRRHAGRRAPHPCHEPAVRRPLGAPPHLVAGSLVEIASTNVRHGREDVAIFEIGKGFGDDAGVIREWWRLAIAGCPAQPRSRPGTARRGHSTSTTRRASSSSSAAASASRRRGTPRWRRSHCSTPGGPRW